MIIIGDITLIQMITAAAKCLRAWPHSTCQTSAQYKPGTSFLSYSFSGKGGRFFFLDLVECLMENVQFKPKWFSKRARGL